MSWRRPARHGGVLVACVVLLGGIVLSPVPARAQAGTARVEGRVTDSLSRRPLDGARVQLARTNSPTAHAFNATADADGRYRIDSVLPGEYVIGFDDPLVDSLHLQTPVRTLSVPPNAHLHVDLSTPSAATLRRAYCPPRPDSAAFAVFVGTLRSATDGSPIAGGHVIAQTPTVNVRNGRVQAGELQGDATTHDDGSFFLCGFPLGRGIDVIGVHGSDSSGVLSLDMPPSGILMRDVYVGTSAVTGTVRGVVRRAEGAPLGGARVIVPGTVRQAVSDDSGRFVLRGVPSGTQLLYTRAIGFFPDQRLVDIVGDSTRTVEIRMPTMVSVLDTVHIRGRRVYHERLDFERRKRFGFGTYFEKNDLERLHPLNVTDLLDRTRGVFTTRDQYGHMMLRVRGSTCLPTLVLDGHPIPILEDASEIDQFVRPEEVQAMEVYIGTDAPIEYVRPGSCAVVMIWTNPAMGRPVPR